MMSKVPPQGSVIVYPYLWAHNATVVRAKEGRAALPLLAIHEPRHEVHHLVL
jgi:hypothetical protein